MRDCSNTHLGKRSRVDKSTVFSWGLFLSGLPSRRCLWCGSSYSVFFGNALTDAFPGWLTAVWCCFRIPLNCHFSPYSIFFVQLCQVQFGCPSWAFPKLWCPLCTSNTTQRNHSLICFSFCIHKGKGHIALVHHCIPLGYQVHRNLFVITFRMKPCHSTWMRQELSLSFYK